MLLFWWEFGAIEGAILLVVAVAGGFCYSGIVPVGMQWRAFTGRADKGHETRVRPRITLQGDWSLWSAEYFTDTDTTGYICPRSVCMEHVTYIVFFIDISPRVYVVSVSARGQLCIGVRFGSPRD